MTSKDFETSAVFGSLAYDLDSAALELQLDEAGTISHEEAAPVVRRRSRPQPQAKTRSLPLVIGGIVSLCALVMVLLLGQVQLTRVSIHSSQLKANITQLTSENITLTTNYEKTFDLATIQRVAQENGMSKPSSGQIEYIDLGGSDTAVVYADMSNVTTHLTGQLSAVFDQMWEYFR